MHPQISLDAFIEDGRERVRCEISVSAPIPSPDEDFYCEVDAPALRVVSKRVFGVDEAQAHELAIKLLVALLGNRRLVDKSGMAIDLSTL